MNSEKSNKSTPKYSLPKKVIHTGQTTLDYIDDILGKEFEAEEPFFWVFQRWIWSVLKFFSIFGIIAFFIWIVWSPKESLEKTKITLPKNPISVVKPKEVSKVLVPPVTTSSTKDVILAAQWNDRIEIIQAQKLASLPTNGLFWVKQASAFFDIPAQLFVDGDSPQARKKKIESTLQGIEKLLEQSKDLLKNFNTQIAGFDQKISQEEQTAQEKGKAISAAFANKNAAQAEQLLSEKITAEQGIAILSNEMKWYKTVFFEVEKYDRGLQAFHENIVANKDALIQNVRVVTFPNDPFSRTYLNWELMKTLY